jgi:glutathione S-transferase
MQGEERAFEIVKQVDASIDDVFRAFTEAELLAGWWGPEGFTVSDVTSEARAGGAFRLVMTGPEGGLGQLVEGTYREVARPSHVVAEISAVAADGSPLVTAVLTIDLEEADGRTEIHLSGRGTAYATQGEGMLAGMQEGWTSSLLCLERSLEQAHGSTLKARHETA